MYKTVSSEHFEWFFLKMICLISTPQLIVVFAIIAAAFAGVPATRSERAVVYNAGVPLAYSAGAVPLTYSSSVYSGAPVVSAYNAVPSVYGSYPAATVYSGAYPTVYAY
jgi:hypothetical protein